MNRLFDVLALKDFLRKVWTRLAMNTASCWPDTPVEYNKKTLVKLYP